MTSDAVRMETEPSIISAREKLEARRYHERLMFKPGESVDMNLLDENRSLIFAGRLMGCLEEGLEWRELFVLLFDNYLVITKPVDKNEVTMYKVKRRPIPLDLLTIIRINDPPTRSYIFSYSPSTTTSSTPSSDSSCLVYPFTFYQSGRSSRKHTLFAESEAARAEWTKRLAAALDLRKDFQAANKVLAIKTLSINTFLLLDVKKEAEGSVYGTGLVRQLSDAACYTGKVNCSVLFNTADGRWLIAIGTEEGLWIGFKRDPKSLRRVAHMRKITQCAVLEDFGIFLILTDKALVAYPVQSFVPSTLQTPQVSQAPQKLNGTKDVCFFRVGKVKGRVVVIFVHNKPSGSDFTLLEPVKSTNMDGKEQPTGFRSWLGFKSTASDWFKRYKNFSLSIEAFDLIFMKGKIVVLYAKGFEIMDLDGLDGMTVPQIHYPSSKHLKNRCEQCRPIAIYCSTPDMYLLCYDEFGVFVDKHGKPTTGIVIEWESRAESAIQYPSHVLLFSPFFIEIRSLATGRLVQFVAGDNIRCIWDGRGADDTYEFNGAHAAADGPEIASVGGQPLPLSHHVFQLKLASSFESQS